MPFTLVNAGNYRTENKLKIQKKQILITTPQKKGPELTVYPSIVTRTDWSGLDCAVFYVPSNTV